LILAANIMDRSITNLRLAINERSKSATADLGAGLAWRDGSEMSAALGGETQSCQHVTWATAPPTLNADRNEVHIWRVKANEFNTAMLMACVSEVERARAECFRLPASRMEFIVARGFTRLILGRYLSILPGAVRLREGQHGKPELASRVSGRRLTFNLSHSRGVILAAITVDQEVGIDIEFVDSRVHFSEIARIVFSPAENRWLSHSLNDKGPRKYFQCWTRKEALLKAMGEGLSDKIRQVEIVPASGPLVPRIAGVASDQWMLKDLDISDGFVAAVAVASRNCRFQFWEWPEP
jgi:4'-phosphopantetheinyl transferase